MKVGMIGMGNMGSATSNLIASNGHELLGWDYYKDVVSEINRFHRNSRFLKGFDLDDKIAATNKIEDVFDSCQVIFIAIHSRFIRGTLEPVCDRTKPDTIIVSLVKGIDAKSGLTSFQLLTQLFPLNKKLLLSGPTIANEFVQKIPTAVVIAAQDPVDFETVSKIIGTDSFVVRYSDDVIGVELGGALKNIYSIGLGLLDGKDVTSRNLRSAYITYALNEIAGIGVALGAKRETFFNLAGLGDLIATSFSQHSHNRRFGELLSRGKSVSEIETIMGVLPEGYFTVRTILSVAKDKGFKAPLAAELWEIIEGRSSVEEFLNERFLRILRDTIPT